MLFQKIKLAYKAIKVYSLRKRLERVKLNGYRRAHNLPPLVTLWDYTCGQIRGLLRPVASKFRTERPKRQFIRNLKKSGTFESGLMKKVSGFVAGLGVSWLLFLFLFYQTDSNRLETIFLGTSTTIFLSFGLATSTFIRSIVGLMLPTLLSSKGRILIMAYVCVLTLNGPVKNMVYNMDELSRSITCGKQLAVNITKETLKEMASPLVIFKESIKKCVDTMRRFVIQIKEAFLSMKELFQDITNSIKNIFKWLRNIVDVCNEKMGQPYRKCVSSFDDAIEDCRAKLGLAKFMCSVVEWVKPICNVARIGELLCKFPEYVKTFIIEKINSVFRGFLDDIYNEFYVNVTFYHEYKYSLNKSKTYEAVLNDIKASIHKKLRWLLVFSDVFTCLGFAFSSYVVVKALLYRSKYLKKDAFDNRYIGKRFLAIEMKRAQMGKETVLPLNFREKQKFIRPFSLRMDRGETRKLVTGLISFSTPAFQATVLMMNDYLLYQAMYGVRHLVYSISLLRMPAKAELHVKGYGALAEMYRNIGQDLNPMSQMEFKRDMSCCPNPKIPDYDTYQRIFVFLALMLISILTESYLLRIRHLVMGICHPERARERATWLYNQVLSQKGSFLKFIRRQLRRKVLGDSSVEKVSLCQRLAARYPFLRVVFSSCRTEKQNCVLCSTKAATDDASFTKCESLGCPGRYCSDCFRELQRKCTLCLQPMEYGDQSDASEELDSSDIEDYDVDYSENWSYQDGTASETSESLAGPPKLFQERDEEPKSVELVQETDSSSSSSSDGNECDADLTEVASQLQLPRSEIIRMKSRAKELLMQESEDESVALEPEHRETRKLISKAKRLSRYEV